MLKKFKPKGEYLYVGLFVISSFAISINPIKHISGNNNIIVNAKNDVITSETSSVFNEDGLHQSKLSTKLLTKLKDSIFSAKESFLEPISKTDLATLDNGREKYTYLKLDNIFNHAEYHHIFFEDKKINLVQARNLADFISSTYKIKLDVAETIVLNVYKEATKHNLDPLLMLSLIESESSYQKNSISVVGAVGLTQVYPIYHEDKISKLKNHNLDLWSIQGNIMIGSLILREYIDLSKGNVALALQRYNGSSRDSTLKYSTKIFSFREKLEQVAKI